MSTAPVIELSRISKSYGNVRALEDVSLMVRSGQVTCILGDNGAGKSTLIKIVSGLHPHDSGTLRIDGKETHFSSPRQALDHGIATVYQDLALVALMPVWRNFFLGSELLKGVRPIRRLDIERMRRTARDELEKIGIMLPDIDAPVGKLSGGEMQVVAIARAIYFGARVLILDEPTAALGVKQSGIVLKYIATAREMGLAVIFISHNPHHAYLVGDHFVVLHLGRMELDANRMQITLSELIGRMAGGAELEALEHELDHVRS
jgi:simple sugar transport system ATP-binding protein